MVIEKYEIQSIGNVRRKERDLFIEIKDEFRPAMKELENFSHLQVIWWADKHDNPKSRVALQCTPPYGENPPLTGVFATRAEYRPNPIALTTVKILNVNHGKGITKIKNIDAFDNTPILDLKAYFPVCDRVKKATIPAWIKGWPEWLLEEGLGL